MSAAAGIFTRAFGVGSGTLFPLPTREEGSYGIGKGRAAGHRVQLADWAYLIEAAEQRAPWANPLGSVKHDLYPHNCVHRTYDAQGTETGNTENTRAYPSVAAWQAVEALKTSGLPFMKPDIAPPSSHVGFWNLSGAETDRDNYLYQFESTFSTNYAQRLRAVDDVRGLFWDVKNCTRTTRMPGAATYYENGAAVSSGPTCRCVGPWKPTDWPDHASRTEADEMRRGYGSNADVADLLFVHREVAQHQDFAAVPAYAVVQFRAYQQHDGVIVRNWGEYITAAWTISTTATQAWASVDLASCGATASALASWMNSKIGTYVSGDSYTGTVRVEDLACDLALPIDRGLYLGWTWTPNAA